MIHRRSLITGLISLVAAPAIVRATSIMPVRATRVPLVGHVLYVEQNGTNWIADGSIARPFQTIQAAMSYIGDNIIYDHVTVNIRSGAFAGFKYAPKFPTSRF